MSTGWEDDFYRALGGRIRERRDDRGITQERLARHLGLSRASVANAERGKQRLLVHQVVAIAGFLGVALADLIGDSAAARRDPLEALHEDIRKKLTPQMKATGS